MHAFVSALQGSSVGGIAGLNDKTDLLSFCHHIQVLGILISGVYVRAVRPADGHHDRAVRQNRSGPAQPADRRSLVPLVAHAGPALLKKSCTQNPRYVIMFLLLSCCRCHVVVVVVVVIVVVVSVVVVIAVVVVIVVVAAAVVVVIVAVIVVVRLVAAIDVANAFLALCRCHLLSLTY